MDDKTQLEKQRDIIQLVQHVNRSQAPRLAALQHLSNRLKTVYLIRDIDGGEAVLMPCALWFAWCITYPDRFIFAVEFYRGLLTQGPPYVWSTGWWLIAGITFVGFITGNYELRRLGWAICSAAWMITAIIVHGDVGLTTLGGFVYVFAYGSLWTWIRLNLDQRKKEADLGTGEGYVDDG